MSAFRQNDHVHHGDTCQLSTRSTWAIDPLTRVHPLTPLRPALSLTRSVILLQLDTFWKRRDGAVLLASIVQFSVTEVTAGSQWLNEIPKFVEQKNSLGGMYIYDIIIIVSKNWMFNYTDTSNLTTMTKS